jgi:hypothetical protein
MMQTTSPLPLLRHGFYDGLKNGLAVGIISGLITGGDACFRHTEPDSSTAQTKDPKIGANPHKGLLAFQETDGDILGFA